MNSKVPFSQEESEYAAVWLTRPGGPVISIFQLSEVNTKEKKSRPEDDDLAMIPPPYVPPLPAAPPLHAEEQMGGKPRN